MRIAGQTPLQVLDTPLPPELSALLRSLWIESVEELAALAAIPALNTFTEQGARRVAEAGRAAHGALAFLPSAARERVSTSAPMGALGYLVTPEAVEAYRSRGGAAVAVSGTPMTTAPMPARVDLRALMHAVRDQGTRGTCAAFATVALREFLEPSRIPLSEQYLYCKCKEIDGVPGPGTFLHTAMSILHKHGVCQRKTWPYVPEPVPGNEGQGPPPREAEREAEAYIMSYTRSVQPSYVTQYKQTLAGDDALPGMPVVVGTLVFASWALSSEGQRTGKITMPFPGEEPIGGHAWCLVGYQDDSSSPGGGYFIVRNSWGEHWAPDSPEAPGHAVMPYAYVERCALEAFSGQATEHIQVLKTPDALNGNATPAAIASLAQRETAIIRGIAANVERHAAGLAREQAGKSSTTVLRQASFDDREMLMDEAVSRGLDRLNLDDLPVNKEQWLVLGTGMVKRPVLSVSVKSFCGSRALEIKTGEHGLVLRHIESFLAQVEQRKTAKTVAAPGVMATVVIVAPNVDAKQLAACCVAANNNVCYFINTPIEEDEMYLLGSSGAAYGPHAWLALLPSATEKRVGWLEKQLALTPGLEVVGDAVSIADAARHLCLPKEVIVYFQASINCNGTFRMGPDAGPPQFIQRR